MDDYAADIAGLLDQLGIQKTAIAGHSMGGYVALAFASLYPDRVSGLGLVSSQVLADPPDRREGRYKSAAEVAEKGITGVVEAMTPKFTSDAKYRALHVIPWKSSHQLLISVLSEPWQNARISLPCFYLSVFR